MGDLEAFDVKDGERLWSKSVGGSDHNYEEAPVVSQDGRVVIASDGARLFEARDAASGELLWRAEREGRGGTGLFTPDGARFIAPGGRALRAYRLEDGEVDWEVALDRNINIHASPVLFRNGTELLVSSGGFGLLRVDTVTGKVLREYEQVSGGYVQHGAPVFLPDERAVLLANGRGKYFRVDLQTGESRQVGTAGKACPLSFSVSGDGRFAYQGADGIRRVEAVALELD